MWTGRALFPSVRCLKVRVVILEDQSFLINGKSDVADWWEAVGGSDLGISGHIPPGVQIRSSADYIEAVPASHVVTGSEGTVEISLAGDAIDATMTFKDLEDHQGRYLVCVTSPVERDLIAGCGSIHVILDPDIDNTVFIYFSNGRAFVGHDGRDRYLRSLDGTSASDEAPEATTTVTFVMGDYPVLSSNELVAVVKDADIGNWWETISKNGENSLNIDPDAYGYGITLNSDLNSLPARIVSSGDDGTAEIDLKPADYLFCYITTTTVLDCDHAYIEVSQHHTFIIATIGTGDISITKLSESDGIQLIQDSKNWEVH